jgi:acyl-CoA reductase-like NAD-dependent aldehyde dehydrogenase
MNAVVAFIDEAKTEGILVAGGEKIAGDGYLVAPTSFRDIPDTARLVREEQFGPVLPILAYDDLDDEVARANNSQYGLGGSIWISNPQRGMDVASRTENGAV